MHEWKLVLQCQRQRKMVVPGTQECFATVQMIDVALLEPVNGWHSHAAVLRYWCCCCFGPGVTGLYCLPVPFLVFAAQHKERLYCLSTLQKARIRLLFHSLMVWPIPDIKVVAMSLYIVQAAGCGTAAAGLLPLCTASTQY